MLIIEDEPMLRGSMARGLSRLSELDVQEAGSLEEALERLDARRPDLVLSDIDLPGRSGIELLGELSRRRLAVPVVFISAYLKAYGHQIPPHADIDVREKPIGLEELRQLVVGKLGAEPAAGEAPFMVTDYLQLAGIGRHSVVIEVGDDGGRGRIVVVAGEPWSAEDAQGGGEAAFRRLVLARSGAVRCQTLRQPPTVRNLEGDWQHMLLDAARLEDEATREAAPRAFDDVWEAGVAALRAKDFEAALRAFLEARALRPGDAWVAVNLERLRRMGYEDPGGDGASPVGS